MSVKSLMIKGDFKEGDLLALTAAFREIERRQPDKRFLFAILEADLSLEEGKALVERIFPRVDGKEPVIQVFKKE